MKRTRIIVVAIVVILLAAVTVGRFVSVTHHRQVVTVSSDATALVVSYKGQAGKDALTLLKQQASVGQASSGLVTSINGVKADTTKRQYWAFYINGHLASIGPADYKTKDKDTITWKMEKY